jgi:hypothetical protein
MQLAFFCGDISASYLTISALQNKTSHTQLVAKLELLFDSRDPNTAASRSLPLVKKKKSGYVLRHFRSAAATADQCILEEMSVNTPPLDRGAGRSRAPEIAGMACKSICRYRTLLSMVQRRAQCIYRHLFLLRIESRNSLVEVRQIAKAFLPSHTTYSFEA